MNYIFLLSILAMVLVYPVYFYMLNEFRQRLMQDHPMLWEARRRGSLVGALQVAYMALREINQGELDGVRLSERVSSSHRIATILLYSGMVLFMVLLFVGLYDAVWGAGQRTH